MPMSVTSRAPPRTAPLRRWRGVGNFVHSLVAVLPNQSTGEVSDDDDKKNIKSSSNRINHPVGCGKCLIVQEVASTARATMQIKLAVTTTATKGRVPGHSHGNEF